MTALLSSRPAVEVHDQMQIRIVGQQTRTPEPFPFELAGQIAAVIARRVCKSGLSELGDEDDVVQEMLFSAWRRWHHFDPDKASASTYVSLVMRNVATSLMRSALAMKRQPRVAGVTKNVVPFNHAIDWPQVDTRQSNVDSRLDIEELMSRLPIDLQVSCRLLMDGSIAEVARALGVPRHHVVGQIHEMRNAFEMAGFAPVCAWRPLCQ